MNRFAEDRTVTLLYETLTPVWCEAGRGRVMFSAADDPSVSQSVLTITEKAPTTLISDRQP